MLRRPASLAVGIFTAGLFFVGTLFLGGLRYRHRLGKDAVSAGTA